MAEGAGAVPAANSLHNTLHRAPGPELRPEDQRCKVISSIPCVQCHEGKYLPKFWACDNCAACARRLFPDHVQFITGIPSKDIPVSIFA